MTPRVLTLCLLLMAANARADLPPDLKPESRVQRRFVEKRGRFAVYAGGTWLARSNFYRSPGIEAAVSYYILESLGVDVRGAWLITSPTDELRDLEAKTGYTPDSHPSKGLVLVGARWSIGYAKLRISKSIVVHFEPQLFLYGGVHLMTNVNSSTLAAPMGELGLGFLVHASTRVQARIDAGVTVDGEQRTSTVAVVGSLPVISVGVMF